MKKKLLYITPEVKNIVIDDLELLKGSLPNDPNGDFIITLEKDEEYEEYEDVEAD